MRTITLEEHFVTEGFLFLKALALPGAEEIAFRGGHAAALLGL